MGMMSKRRIGSKTRISAAARARLTGYARAVVGSSSRTSRETWLLLRWLAKRTRDVDLVLSTGFIAAWYEPEDSDEPTVSAWRALQTQLNAQPALARSQRPFAGLAKLLGFDRIEEAILTLCYDYRTVPACETLWDQLADHRGKRMALAVYADLFSLLLDVDAKDISVRLGADAPLRASGLLLVDEDRDIALLPRLMKLMIEDLPKRDLCGALLGTKAKASLAFSAFAHLGPDADRARALLRGALDEAAVGVHVLLYGPPGTGKTEFAAALAEECGVPLYEVGTQGPDGEELSRSERVGELGLAQRLLASGQPALVLLDEAEDLFDSGFELFSRKPRSGSRAFMHRMLETAQVPMIWTANDLESFSPAVLRRMSCCIEIRIPPVSVRQQLWRKAAASEGLDLPEAQARSLARLLPAAPALVRSSMRAARLAGGDIETVRWAVQGVARAMAGGRLPPVDSGTDEFDPALLNADCDLTALTERLAAAGASRRVSLLLSGPPGSGKSAYARYLAERMGLPVLIKRASDLFNAYVGQTEQAIARAFAEARNEGAFLVFDEADSLLSDRAGAHRSWEVSQVNEMLTWMECHELPFCCTTNLLDRIDTAAMRRFLVKARFDFLTPVQTARAWRNVFGGDAPAGLTELMQLTPADFALVQRMAEISGTLNDRAALLSALEREQRAKPAAKLSIGFRPPHSSVLKQMSSDEK